MRDTLFIRVSGSQLVKRVANNHTASSCSLLNMSILGCFKDYRLIKHRFFIRSVTAALFCPDEKNVVEVDAAWVILILQRTNSLVLWSINMYFIFFNFKELHFSFNCIKYYSPCVQGGHLFVSWPPGRSETK